MCRDLPKKPIYDIPSRPEILAGDLVDQLMTQIQPFKPGFTLGETAQEIHKERDGSFVVTTDKGTQHHAQVVAIAGGLGTFEPRKPDLANLILWEDKGWITSSVNQKNTATKMCLLLVEVTQL